MESIKEPTTNIVKATGSQSTIGESTQQAPVLILPFDVMAEIFDTLGYSSLLAVEITCKSWREHVITYIGGARLSVKARCFAKSEGTRALPRHLDPYKGLLDNRRSHHFSVLFTELGDALKQIELKLQELTIQETQQGILGSLMTMFVGGNESSKPLWKALYGVARGCLRDKAPMIFHKLYTAKELGFLHTLSCWGADLEAKDTNDHTILELASAAGDTKAVLAMLSAGARINLARGQLERTLLHWAAHHGDRTLGRDLMRIGANPYLCQKGKEENENHTPYELAFFQEHRRFCQMLLKHGLDLNALEITPRKKETWHISHDESLLAQFNPLRLSLYCPPGTSLMEFNPEYHKSNFPALCAKGASIGHLHHAIWSGHLRLTKHLLVNGALPNLSSGGGWSPLQLAVVTKSTGATRTLIVKALVQCGAEIIPSVKKYRFGAKEDSNGKAWLKCGGVPRAIELAIQLRLPQVLQALCHHNTHAILHTTLQGTKITPLDMIRLGWDRRTTVKALGIALTTLGERMPPKRSKVKRAQQGKEETGGSATKEGKTAPTASTSNSEESNKQKRTKGKEPIR